MNLKNIESLIRYINDHLVEISIDEIEYLYRLIPQSKSSLDKKFKAKTGHTMIQYIKILKLNKARDLLLSNPRLFVKELIYLVNYHTEEKAFSRDFKKQHGFPPKSYVHYQRSNYTEYEPDTFDFFLINNKRKLDEILFRLCLLCFPKFKKEKHGLLNHEYGFDVSNTAIQFDWGKSVNSLIFSVYYDPYSQKLNPFMMAKTMFCEENEVISFNQETPYLSCFNNIAKNIKEHPHLNPVLSIKNWNELIASEYSVDFHYRYRYSGIELKEQKKIELDKTSLFYQHSNDFIRTIKNEFEDESKNYLISNHKVDPLFLRSLCDCLSKKTEKMENLLREYFKRLPEVENRENHIELIFRFVDCPIWDFDLEHFPDTILTKSLLKKLSIEENPEQMVNYTLSIINRMDCIYSQDQEAEVELRAIAESLYKEHFN